MLRSLFFFAALGLASGPALAQASNDYGSAYSRFALGQRYDFSTSQAEAMGLAGVAIRSGIYNGISNPALGADQSLTTFSASGGIRGVQSTDATDATSEATAGDLGLIQLGIPLYPGRMGLTLAYRPYSRVDYRAIEEGAVDIDGDEPTPFRANIEGQGGLQRLSIGLGARVGKVLTVGASAEALVGTVEYLQRTEFPEGGAAFLETRESVSTRMYGFTGTLGAAASLRSLAREADALTIAGALTLPTTLNASRSRLLGANLDRDTLATQRDGDVRVPLTARGGVSYQYSPKFLVSTDAIYEPWQSFESDFAFGGFAPARGDDAEESILRSRWRVGAGMEWVPGGGERNARYFQRVNYRLGAYTETGFMSPEAEDVMTYALTGGLSLPTRVAGARVDLGFEAGTRGKTQGVLVRDRFWRATFTLNFGERWFVRRRLG